MRRRGPTVLLLLLLILTLAAAAVLGLDARAQRRHPERAEEFQRLVGGLGLGPALDLSGGPFRFDPRLADRPDEAGPLPGDLLGRGRSQAIFSYPPLDRPADPGD
jgi:hypothetical protein